GFLQQLYKYHQPEYWFFGHFHINKIVHDAKTTFICLDELEYMDFDFDTLTFEGRGRWTERDSINSKLND
ncbi:unnamed protein product, partial [marine sediment metagenome]